MCIISFGRCTMTGIQKIVSVCVIVFLSYVVGEQGVGTVSRPVELTVGDWFLAFRAQAENSQSVTEAYVSSNGTDELNASPGCVSVHGDDFCEGHYRHSVLDSWDSKGVKKVKLVLYKKGTQVAFVTFNAVRADMTNWFDRRRIISSSWTDLTPGTYYNKFEFFGLHNHLVNRRLYINKSFGGCPNDQGWMIVVEGKGVCAFDKYKKYPVFLYSTNSEAVNLNTNVGEADVLAIYLQFVYPSKSV